MIWETLQNHRLEREANARLDEIRSTPKSPDRKNHVVFRQFGKALFLESGYLDSSSKVPRGTARGKIKGFSLQANQRFCELLVKIDHEATVKKWGAAKWITLTFDGKETGADNSKKSLDYLLSKVLPRAGYGGPSIWKAELQKRGTIHFHILHFGGDERMADLIAEKWHRITGSKQDAHLIHGTDCADVPDVKRLRCYLAKYLTKETGDASRWDLGRVWGKVRASGLVFHEEKVFEIDGDTLEGMQFRLKREGIQVPSRIYDFEEYFVYVDEQLALKKDDRIGYYHWRKIKAIERKKDQKLHL